LGAFADDFLFAVLFEMVGDEVASEGSWAEFDGFCDDAYLVVEGGWCEVVYLEVRADAFFVVFEVIFQDFSCGDFHVVGHGPCGVDAVDDDGVEGGAHIFGDGDDDFGGVAELE